MEGICNKFVCIFLIAALLSACTSLQPVYPAADIIENQVRAGDYIRVATRNDGLLKFKVKEVGADKLIGEDQAVAYKDIEQIEVKRYDAKKTVLLLGGLLVGVVLLYEVATIFAAPSQNLP